MTTWTVVYERTATGWSAFVPALPGVAAAGETRLETEELIGDAITFHVRGLEEDGLPVPDPDSVQVGKVDLLHSA